MITQKNIIRFLQKYGLYPFARSVYHQLNPKRRQARKANREFYARLISPGDLCYDVGANVGQTIEALITLGANVVTVEPNQYCLKVLNKRFGNRHDVQILGVALGATPGRAKLYCSGTDSTASLREDWPFPNDETQDVEVSTLDALIAKFGCPKLLKVDVEGFEVEVIRGLSHPVPIIYFEMHGREIERAKGVLAALSKIGDIDSINLVTVDNSHWYFDEWIKYENFFSMPPDPPPWEANHVESQGDYVDRPARFAALSSETKAMDEGPGPGVLDRQQRHVSRARSSQPHLPQ